LKSWISLALKNFASPSHIIKCYLGSREGLKELGILRSGRNLQGDYAEWLTAELLNLKLAESIIQRVIIVFMASAAK
jgi:hypothetical protein